MSLTVSFTVTPWMDLTRYTISALSQVMKHSYELCLHLVAAQDRSYMISQVNDSHVKQCYDTRMCYYKIPTSAAILLHLDLTLKMYHVFWFERAS